MTTEQKLPPLPKHDHAFQDLEGEQPDILLWNAESMRRYARAAVEGASSAAGPRDFLGQPINPKGL